MSDKSDSSNAREKDAMLEALSLSLSIVSTACSKVGISRQTHYRWLEDDEEYARQVQIIKDERLDFMESKLHELANGVVMFQPITGQNARLCVKNERGEWVPVEGETAVQIYKRAPCVKAITTALKCIGKERGWSERTEITGADGESMQRVVYVDKEMKQIADNHIDEVINGSAE